MGQPFTEGQMDNHEHECRFFVVSLSGLPCSESCATYACAWCMTWRLHVEAQLFQKLKEIVQGNQMWVWLIAHSLSNVTILTISTKRDEITGEVKGVVRAPHQHSGL